MQQRLGRYELLERIAAGGQGTVWRARDTVLDRIVAVKVLNQPVLDDPQYLEALQREARLAGGLVHPNITAVHDFQVERETAYIVMEYVPDTLSNYLQDGRPIPYQRAVEIAIQICRALSHAHSREVIHRDIKLQNILLTEEGNVKVSDFGIARALASSTRSSATSTMGTPFYMSPEQWGGARVDGRADIYSLGILLYEMLTGSVPFKAESIGAIYVQHRESAIPTIPGVPDAVEAVMRMALEKDPDSRFSNAEAMANALQRSLNPASAQGQPDSNTPISQPPSPPQPPPQGPPSGTGGFSRWLIFGGSGVLLLIIMLVVIGFVIGSSDSGDRDVMVGIPDPTITPYLLPTARPTYTLFPTATPRPTYTPAPTYTPYPTATPRPTLTPTPRPTSTPTPYARASSFYEKGNKLYDQEEYQLAIGEFDRAIALVSTNNLYYQHRGRAYQRLGEYQRAIQDYDKAIQLNPNDSDAYGNRGISYAALGQDQRAIQDFDRVIQLDPNDPRAYVHRGYSYSELGQHQQAIQDYDKAIQLDPNNSYTYGNRGFAYSELGQDQRAIQDYDKAIQLDPNDSNAYNNRGFAYSELGQDQRAIQDYDKAIQLNPDFIKAYGNRGYSYNELGQYQRAIQDYDKAIQLDPDDSNAYLNRGFAYSELGQHQRAIQDYDKTILLDFDDALAYNNRGIAYYNLGLYQLAEQDFDIACSFERIYCN